jgi:hypothetical protein
LSRLKQQRDDDCLERRRNLTEAAFIASSRLFARSALLGAFDDSEFVSDARALSAVWEEQAR